ncbi:hypothetical protein SAMN04489729_1839 [Amycolatopsis lurida]|nr:hypothetical protein SAMN04489729_1839 [Amycolatopsis lurida]
MTSRTSWLRPPMPRTTTRSTAQRTSPPPDDACPMPPPQPSADTPACRRKTATARSTHAMPLTTTRRRTAPCRHPNRAPPVPAVTEKTATPPTPRRSTPKNATLLTTSPKNGHNSIDHPTPLTTTRRRTAPCRHPNRAPTPQPVAEKRPRRHREPPSQLEITRRRAVPHVLPIHHRQKPTRTCRPTLHTPAAERPPRPSPKNGHPVTPAGNKPGHLDETRVNTG